MTFFSFLDDAFRKNLESALRFGNPLLVQDVESYDPILNPVLNKEVKRTGGRVLITLGDTDIDLSPSFQIFLSTRDPTVSDELAEFSNPRFIHLLSFRLSSPPIFALELHLSISQSQEVVCRVSVSIKSSKQRGQTLIRSDQIC